MTRKGIITALAGVALAALLLLVTACDSSRGRAAAASEQEERQLTVTGVLTRVAAIGGETTGWAMNLDEPVECGEKVTKLLEVSAAREQLEPYEETRITATGRLVWNTGVERGRWPVLQIQAIREAPQRSASANP